jgi:translation elongation factor EF-Tu-like GTPase
MPGDHVTKTIELITPIAMEKGLNSLSAKAPYRLGRRRGRDH